jgi:hypothetical protein
MHAQTQICEFAAYYCDVRSDGMPVLDKRDGDHQDVSVLDLRYRDQTS